MSKVKLIIEIIVDGTDVEIVAYDFRKIFWNHTVGMHSYKSKTEKIPKSELPLRSGESESSL